MEQPKVIGTGSYGCVHKPQLECVNKNKTGEISKYMKAKHATEELKEFKLITKADPNKNFHLGKPTRCIPAKNAKNFNAISECNNNEKFNPRRIENYRLLLLKYGGLDLEKYGRKTKTLLKNKVNVDNNKKFWVEMYRIINALTIMLDNGIVHHDLKHQNIVYNPDTNRANIIDFGLMTTKEDIISESKKDKYWLGKTHWSFPFEMGLYNYTSYQKVSIYENSKNNYSYKIKDEFTDVNSYFFTSIINKQHNKEESKLIKNKMFEKFDVFLTETDTLEYEKFIDMSINTIDSYGTGIGLLYVLQDSKHLLEDELYKDFVFLFLSMVEPNLFLRKNPYQIKDKYYEILTRHNLITTPESTVSASPTPLPRQPPMSDIEFLNNIVIQCPEGKELNPKTNRCIKVCKDGYSRDDNFKCKKNKTNKKSKSIKRKRCPKGTRRNKTTGNCEPK